LEESRNGLKGKETIMASRMEDYSGGGASANGHYRVIGTRPIRHDGLDKVTGRAQYGADLRLAGMLHGRVLRSPHAHARIRRIDASRALALPGVKAVVTAADFPSLKARLADLGEGMADVKDLRDNVLASDKALYAGHAVAAVAAASPHVAVEALRLIEVDYEVLPPVLDVREAMAPDAPLLHDDLFTDDLGEKAATASNVARHLVFEIGDVEDGFLKADQVFEREFATSMVHQGYIEPHNATAVWSPDGQITIWCSTQGAFTVREQTAGILQVPVSRIKVVPMEIGGGFGGKIPIYLEPLAAVLSRKTGQPVKMLMDRTEVFEGTGPTPGSVVRVKMGAARGGRIVAAEAWLAYEAGAYKGALVQCGMMTIFAPYDIENVRIDGYDVVVNKPKTAPYRAPGATSAAFASESVIDEIAEWAGMDPLELRILNGAREGTRRADGIVYPRIGAIETAEAARAHPHYRAPLEGPNRGRGVASGFWFNCGLKSSVNVAVNADGTVNLIEGSTDIGGTRTSLAMQLAEALGIAAEDVKPQVADTDSVGFNDVTGGSRVTFASGLAAIEAARDVQRQMAARAAKLWEVAPGEVEADGALYRLRADPSKSIGFKDLAAKLHETGGPLVGHGTVDATTAVGGGFGTHIVDVEVDPETGKVSILRYTAVQDAGKAVHPSYVEGQMQGGAVQGIGWALNEEYFYGADGRLRNSSFLDYRMPTTLDLPMIDTVIVEVPNPGHPFGVRGVGEVPIVPPPAAIANAIYRATGVRFTRLPMNPARVLGGILAARGEPVPQ
jgi:CO/xanthine dehydrogenase Mo-binding subunit